MSIDACARMVERGDADRFMSAMTAPRALRPRLMVLYAFNLEIARASWLTDEAMIAEMRLQFWRDTLDAIVTGGTSRAHDVALPLAELASEAALDFEALRAMIDARAHDIARAPFGDAVALDHYLAATGGNLMWATAQALGAKPGDEAAIRGCGAASGLAALLQAIPGLKARGWQPLSSTSPDAIAALAETGLARLSAGRQIARGPWGAALRSGWMSAAILKAARRDPSAIAAGRLQFSEFRRRGSLLYKTLVNRW